MDSWDCRMTRVKPPRSQLPLNLQRTQVSSLNICAALYGCSGAKCHTGPKLVTTHWRALHQMAWTSLLVLVLPLTSGDLGQVLSWSGWSVFSSSTEWEDCSVLGLLNSSRTSHGGDESYPFPPHSLGGESPASSSFLEFSSSKLYSTSQCICISCKLKRFEPPAKLLH